MSNSRPNTFNNVLLDGMVHMLTAPPFAGLAAGIIMSIGLIYASFSDFYNNPSIYILIPLFAALFAYPVGFLVAAMTGMIIRVIQPKSAHSQGLWTVMVSSILTMGQVVVIWLFQDVDLNFIHFINSNDLHEMLSYMLQGCIFGGYFYGRFYYKIL